MVTSLFFPLLFVTTLFSSVNSIAAPWNMKPFSSFDQSSKYKKTKKRSNNNGNIFTNAVQSLMTGTIKPGPKFLHHALYWFTSFDALQFVLRNEYASILTTTTTTKSSVYSKLFVFAGLRPRLLFSVGALLRALQICTPFQKVLDPTIGVGAGINLCAILAGSRWVKPVILGWASTKAIWVWLGATQLGNAFVPITLSIHEWEKKKKKGKDEETYNLGGL